MESYVNDSRDEATEALQALSADRRRLTEHMPVPWTLMAAFGALGAWWVGSAATTTPGANYEAPSSVWLGLLGALVVVHLLRRETGIRFRALGVRANATIGVIVVVGLVLFSVSLGLVSFGLHWAVALTSLAAFALVTWLAGMAFRSAVGRLDRG